jgi:hypothetical protein
VQVVNQVEETLFETKFEKDQSKVGMHKGNFFTKRTHFSRFLMQDVMHMFPVDSPLKTTLQRTSERENERMSVRERESVCVCVCVCV